MKIKSLFATAAIGVAMVSTPTKAEVSSVLVCIQNGTAYLPLQYAAEARLIERYAAKAGVTITAETQNLGSPGTIVEQLVSGACTAGAVGVPSLVKLADKMDFRAVGNIVSLPMNLMTTEPAGVGLCDLTGKIALPTVATSVQAVTLQIASERLCNDPRKLDHLTVSRPHPDGRDAIRMRAQTGRGEIQSHFTTPPFQFQEATFPGVRKLLTSYDALGGQTSFILLVASTKFATENPIVFSAIRDALEEAEAWVRENPIEAAKLYIRYEKSKETVDTIVSQITSPDVTYSTTPNRIGVYADFMRKIGSVKKAMTWKDLSFEHLHSRNGS